MARCGSGSDSSLESRSWSLARCDETSRSSASSASILAAVSSSVTAVALPLQAGHNPGNRRHARRRRVRTTPALPDFDELASRLVQRRRRATDLERRFEKAQERLASFPNDGLSAAELVSAADKALARSIELGGNRTVLFSVPRNAPPGWGLARAS